MDISKKKSFLINVAFWAVILIIAFLVFKYLIGLVLPFLFAFVISALLRPVVKLLVSRLRFPETLAAILCTLLFFSIIGGLVILGGNYGLRWMANWFLTLPELYANSIEPALQSIFHFIQENVIHFGLISADEIDGLGPQLIQHVGEAITSLSGTAIGLVSSIASRLPAFIVAFLVTIVATFFASADYDRLSAFLMRQLSERHREIVRNITNSLRTTGLRFIKSYALIMLLTFSQVLVGTWILGIKNPVMISVITAIVDIFPILGTGVILIPWSAFSFLQGNIFRGVGLLIIYIVIAVVRQIMEPRIVGKYVGLYPLATLASMFIGASLFGAIGLFGLPITIVIVKSLYDSGAFPVFRSRSDPSSDPPDTQSEDEASG